MVACAFLPRVLLLSNRLFGPYLNGNQPANQVQSISLPLSFSLLLTFYQLLGFSLSLFVVFKYRHQRVHIAYSVATAAPNV